MKQSMARGADIIAIGALRIHVIRAIGIGALALWGCGGRDISIGENVDGSVAEGATAEDAGSARAVTCGFGGQNVTCDVAAGESCCIYHKSGPITCKAACTSEEISIGCDGPEDCGGQVCCELNADGMSSASNVACDPTCGGQYQRRVCHTAADCTGGDACCGRRCTPGSC